MIYILVRTSNRPNYFKQCMESIRSQVVDDKVRVIVGNDNNDDYCKDYNPVRFERDNSYDIDHVTCIDTAKYFPFNSYLNKMMAQCTEQGWVMILDDDDVFTSRNSLSIIMKHLKEDYQCAFWRVNLKGNIIPSEMSWMRHPVKRDMSMIGFMFHTKYIPLLHVAPYKQADYRLASQVYDLCEPKFIDQVLTATDNEGQGRRKDI